MPTYDYVCAEGHVFEGFYPIGATEIPCRVCAGELPPPARLTNIGWELVGRRAAELAADGYPAGWAIRILLASPSWRTRSANPIKIVVDRDPTTGDYAIPGSIHAPHRPGLERIELNNVYDARKVEKLIGERQQAIANDHLYRQREFYDNKRREGERELREILPTFSCKGREFAEAAIARNEQIYQNKSRVAPAVNSHFEALAFDRSNREAHRSEATGWKAVRE